MEDFVNGIGGADVDAIRRINIKQEVDDLLTRLRNDQTDVEAKLNLLLAGLFDTWSEVRADSAKCLERHQSFLPVQTQARIADLLHPVVELAASGEPVAWQKLHGALRGLRALMPLPKSYTEHLQTLYIALQGHALLPVREEGLRGLLGVCALGTPEQKRSLLDIILKSLQAKLKHKKNLRGFLDSNSEHNLPESNEESLTYSINGLTQGLVGVVDQFSSLEQLAAEHTHIQNNESSPTVAPLSSSATITNRILSLLFEGMADTSSTVRQSAGGGLTTLLRRCMTASSEAHQSKLFHQQALVSIGQKLRAGNVDTESEAAEWGSLEASVLVAEEVIRTHFMLLLGVMRKEGLHSEAGQCVLLPRSFLMTAQDCLPACLLHVKFEVRRVASQLLPTLARYLVLFEREILYRDDAPWVRAACKTSSYTTSNPTRSDLEHPLLQLMVAFAWTAEVAKAQQHVAEALAATASHLSAIDAADIAQSDEFPQPPLCWALEVRGRLAEDEAKQRFHAEVRQLLTGSHAVKNMAHLKIACATVRADTVRLVSCLADAWRRTVKQAVDPCPAHAATEGATVFQLPVVAPAKVSQPAPYLVSADFIEATALACAILLDMGPVAQQRCPDVVLSLTSDSTWIEPCYLLAVLLGATSHLQPLAARGELQGRAMWVVPSVTDPTTEVRSLIPFPGIIGASSLPERRMQNATNRWACEAVAPVLPLLSSLRARQFGSGADDRLVVVVAQWVLGCVGDALWLDHRPHARRALFGVLPPILLASIEHSDDTIGTALDVHRSQSEGHSVLQALASLLTAAIVASGNGRRDLGQQRGQAVEASEIGIIAQACVQLWKTAARAIPTSLWGKLKAGALAARGRLVTSCSAPGSTRSTPIKACAMGSTMRQRELQGVARRLLNAEEEDNENAASAESGKHEDNLLPVSQTTGERDDWEVQLPPDEEFSDWDEESEDELNASSNSVQPLGSANGEVAIALSEIDHLLELLES